jgi:hypothetical protein
MSDFALRLVQRAVGHVAEATAPPPQAPSFSADAAAPIAHDPSPIEAGTPVGEREIVRPGGGPAASPFDVRPEGAPSSADPPVDTAPIEPVSPVLGDDDAPATMALETSATTPSAAEGTPLGDEVPRVQPAPTAIPWEELPEPRSAQASEPASARSVPGSARDAHPAQEESASPSRREPGVPLGQASETNSPRPPIEPQVELADVESVPGAALPAAPIVPRPTPAPTAEAVEEHHEPTAPLERLHSGSAIEPTALSSEGDPAPAIPSDEVPSEDAPVAEHLTFLRRILGRRRRSDSSASVGESPSEQAAGEKKQPLPVPELSGERIPAAETTITPRRRDGDLRLRQEDSTGSSGMSEDDSSAGPVRSESEAHEQRRGAQPDAQLVGKPRPVDRAEAAPPQHGPERGSGLQPRKANVQHHERSDLPRVSHQPARDEITADRRSGAAAPPRPKHDGVRAASEPEVRANLHLLRPQRGVVTRSVRQAEPSLAPRPTSERSRVPLVKSHADRTVHVRIGTVEVRAAPLPAPILPEPVAAEPQARGFEEYAAVRGYSTEGLG